MRLASVLLLVACGALAAACASITGLDAYTSCSGSDCPDATTGHPHPQPESGPADDSTTGDDTSPGDDGPPDGGDDADATTSAADQTSPGDTGVDTRAWEAGEAAPPIDTGMPGADAAAIPCPDGGCPTSTATSYTACPFGSPNVSGAGGGCFCATDSACKSGKCVKVTGENDKSCGSNCTGNGSRDGFDCLLAAPGIPTPSGSTSYSCPVGSGYGGTTLSCDPNHTNCYCTADNQCPSGKCVPNSNNNNCSGCTGTGTPDFRGCQSLAAIPNCPIYIGCPASTTCGYPICYCASDSVCESGHCIAGGHPCTGTCSGIGTDDGHGCQPPPSSVPCQTAGGSSCITTLTPAPVLNSGHTACLCVADGDCSSGKCVNKNNQCTGTCNGNGAADSQNCQTASSTATAWACSLGNCKTVTSTTGTCSAAGVPCWCTADSQCPNETRCSNWAGCATGACTGSGTGNAFNCVP